MKILDPIHKYMHFSEDETSLIDTPVFQRLRHIKQLGFTEQTFLGAVHNRLSHSLGACHLAGIAFNNIFHHSPLSSQKKKEFYKLIRTAVLLHDIGHGPLSHSSEPKMPLVKKLDLPCSKNSKRQARHEDYSLWLILNSELAQILKNSGIEPYHLALLFQQTDIDDDFFIEQGVSYKPVLEQILHSEIDVDRMDYLKRDSYFCGAYYGLMDFDWILKNMSLHIEKNQAFLAVKSPALYTIEDFLLGHHHMHLTVYLHPKNMIYDEMLLKYFNHPECRFSFPPKAEEYIFFNDPKLYNDLYKDSASIEWARRIIYNTPYKNLFQIQYTLKDQKQSEEKASRIAEELKKHSIPYISKRSSSHIAGSFSKDCRYKIYIIDSYSKKTTPLEKNVRVFANNDHIVYMDRVYVDPKDYDSAKKTVQPYF